MAGRPAESLIIQPNTGLVIRALRQRVQERRDYLMAMFMQGLAETAYHQTIGQVQGLDAAVTILDEIEQGN